MQGIDGNLYGATQGGGIISRGCPNGCGTVLKINLAGTFTSLYSFTGGGPHAPVGSLVQAVDGNFYGTSTYGGVNNHGSVFRISPSGVVKELYAFCKTISSCPDGYLPMNGLVQGNDGNLYGTTYFSGNSVGSIFRITPSGTLTTLYNFCSQSNCPDGAHPNRLVQDTNGIFYGTTQSYGTFDNGTVFSLSAGLRPFVETLPNGRKVGAPVSILGTNLTGATGVSFNGKAATFTVVSRSQIRTTVPAGATTGFVIVTTPSGRLQSNVAFQVLP